jgi:RHS repeat-associated protein
VFLILPFGLQIPSRSYNIAFAGNQYKYSGKELDEESGIDWYYFGARYYDPAIGRFLSLDPHADSYPDWTPYNYAYNTA